MERWISFEIPVEAWEQLLGMMSDTAAFMTIMQVDIDLTEVDKQIWVCCSMPLDTVEDWIGKLDASCRLVLSTSSEAWSEYTPGDDDPDDPDDGSEIPEEEEVEEIRPRGQSVCRFIPKLAA